VNLFVKNTTNGSVDALVMMRNSFKCTRSGLKRTNQLVNECVDSCMPNVTLIVKCFADYWDKEYDLGNRKVTLLHSDRYICSFKIEWDVGDGHVLCCEEVIFQNYHTRGGFIGNMGGKQLLGETHFKMMKGGSSITLPVNYTMVVSDNEGIRWCKKIHNFDNGERDYIVVHWDDVKDYVPKSE